MGQKVNPIGLRLGINRTWDSRWYAGKKEYGKLLQEDIKIRDHLSEQLKQAGVSRIVIERPHKKCRITIHSARPGVVIGKKGADIEKLKSDVQKFTTDEVHLNIVEIRKPEIDAKLVAENIAQQLERRVAFRRVMKRAVQSAMRLGALGIRINCGGPPGRRGNRARGMVSRRPRAAAHAARRHRLRRCHRQDDLWHLRREGLDLQGRDHGARSDGDRKAPGGSFRSQPWRGGATPASGAGAVTDNESCFNPNAPNSASSTRAASTAPPRPAPTLNFGAYGLKALEPERIKAREIEAARRAITRQMKRAGRVWIRVFPDVPVSKKPAEVRMGSGKGAPEFWVAKIKPGRILFEIDGVDTETAKEAMRLGAAQAFDRDQVRRRGSGTSEARNRDGEESQTDASDDVPRQDARTSWATS